MFTGKKGRVTTHWVFFLTLPIVGCAPKDAPPPTQFPSQTKKEQAPHTAEDILNAAVALLGESPSPAQAEVATKEVKTQIEELDLDGRPGTETLVIRSDPADWSYEYQFFASSDTTRPPLGSFPGGGRGRGPVHERIELADGLVFLRVRHLEGSGTDVVCFYDSWLRISSDGIRCVLRYPGEGYVRGWGMPFEKRFNAMTIRRAPLGEAPSFEVIFSLDYENIYTDEHPDLTQLFSKQSRARYVWDADRCQFRSDPASSDLSEEDVQDIFHGGCEAFLRMNHTELEALFEKGGKVARAWGRRLLDQCEPSAAKKKLRQTLVRSTGATELWNPADPLRYEGKPIHPLAFDALQTDLSDLSPVERSIDLEGALEADRYASPVTEKDGWVSCEQEGGPNPAFFKYRRLGSTPKGIHVVLTTDCGGGSGVFKRLLFVRVSKERFFHRGEWADRATITLVGEDSSGAANAEPSKIGIEGDCVTVQEKDGSKRVVFSPR